MKKEHKASLAIQGMHCASCAVNIQSGLSKVDGVVEANVNFATEKATVVYDPDVATPDDHVQAVQDSGYEILVEKVTIPIGGMTCASCAAVIDKSLSQIDGAHKVSH